MKLRFSAEAKSDLRDIGDYLATVADPARALSFIRDLRAKSAEICERPLAYPLVQGFEHLGIRRRIIGNYLIFYYVNDSTLTIIHILHGARHYEAFLDEL